MVHRPSAILWYWLVVPSLLMVACASAPHVFESRFSQEYFPSRNGQLRYKLPSGWFNATNDAPSANNLIWLVRDDFAATLAVREVVIDVEARQEANRSGLGRITELVLALAKGEGGVNIIQPPTVSSLRDMHVYAYEYLTEHPSNRVHAILVDTGKKVYEVNALMTGTAASETVGEAVLLQEAFVANILW